MINLIHGIESTRRYNLNKVIKIIRYKVLDEEYLKDLI